MPLLHDSTILDSIRTRVRSLQPTAQRRWGEMTVDQMLWHVNGGLRMALGEMRTSAEKPMPPLAAPIIRFLVLTLPWPKGRTPTLPELKAAASARYDFVAEQARCLTLIEAVAGRSVTGAWPTHPTLGAMTGEHWSRLQARHLDHHLTQFGV